MMSHQDLSSELDTFPPIMCNPFSSSTDWIVRTQFHFEAIWWNGARLRHHAVYLGDLASPESRPHAQICMCICLHHSGSRHKTIPTMHMIYAEWVMCRNANPSSTSTPAIRPHRIFIRHLWHRCHVIVVKRIPMSILDCCTGTNYRGSWFDNRMELWHSRKNRWSIRYFAEMVTTFEVWNTTLYAHLFQTQD